jgi:hypothetical protein
MSSNKAGGASTTNVEHASGANAAAVVAVAASNLNQEEPMPKIPIKAHIVARSDTIKPQERKPPNVQALIKIARAELDSLAHWVNTDPRSPHIAETGHRLLSLAKTLIKIGGQR